MADIVQVIKELKVEDVLPNYEFQLQVPVNEEDARDQKTYLQMFLQENFDVFKSQADDVLDGASPNKSNMYMQGCKDMLAFVNLWIDSLNTLEDQE